MPFKDPQKARENAKARKARYLARKHTEKFGPDAGDMRGHHANHLSGADHYRWRGGNPKPDADHRRANAKASAKRHPERRKARELLRSAIKANRLPPASKLICFDCESMAQSYDHFAGYEFPLRVQAVCYKCHGLRSKVRGEHQLNGSKRITPSFKGQLHPKKLGRELEGRTWDELPTPFVAPQDTR